MKKVLFILSIIFIANSLSADQYVHFSNDTDLRIEIDGLGEDIIVEPQNVRFIKLSQYVTATGRKGIKITKDHPISVGIPIQVGSAGSTLGDAKYIFPIEMDYYAFAFKPITTKEGKKSYEIKQRINRDAKLILEEHKNPTNPMFIGDQAAREAFEKKFMKKP